VPVKEMVADDPLQIVAVPEMVAVGNGFTVTVAVIVNPVQPLPDGVMVYTNVPGVVEVTVNACAIVAPLPEVAPVTFV
jgi:hypothetical protein